MTYMNDLSKHSELLNKVEVNKIITLMLAGYNLESIKKQSDNEIICKFYTDAEKEKITLTIYDKELVFEKYRKDTKEITKIIAGSNDKDNLMINKFICENREKGIIITEIREHYGWTRFTDKEKLPTDLYESRYVFGNDNIKFVYDNIKPVQFEFINKDNINLIIYNLANFKTDFEVHMKNYYVWGLRPIMDCVTPTKVFFNGNDVSYYYDMVDGPHKIEAVHDLYNGIINGDNKDGIKAMHLGLMSTNGFDLRTFAGITAKENAILGNSLEPTEEYQQATNKILKSVIGYDGEIKYDRDSLLNYICHMPRELKHNEEEKIENKEIKKQKRLEFRKIFPFLKK